MGAWGGLLAACVRPYMRICALISMEAVWGLAGAAEEAGS